MLFTKDELFYEKRPLTKDIALWVISNTLPKDKDEIKEFVGKAFPYKSGELAAQVDSCPVKDLAEVRERVGFLKRTYEGFKIRHAQFSGVAATKETVKNIDDETAEYLIAGGSIAVVAPKYEDGSDRILLKHGILPLVSGEDLPVDTFILIRNIRNENDGLRTGEQEAYTVTPDSQVSVDVDLPAYTLDELKNIL